NTVPCTTALGADWAKAGRVVTPSQKAASISETAAKGLRFIMSPRSRCECRRRKRETDDTETASQDQDWVGGSKAHRGQTRVVALAVSETAQNVNDAVGIPLPGAQRDSRIDTRCTTHRRGHCGEQPRPNVARPKRVSCRCGREYLDRVV